MNTRACITCGQTFTPTNGRQVYCTRDCRIRNFTQSLASTTERGYGGAHQRERRKWKPAVDQGQAECAEIICLDQLDGYDRWIQPGTPWDLAHDRTTGGYLGPAHRRCNRAEGARFKQGSSPPGAPAPTTSTANRWPL